MNLPKIGLGTISLRRGGSVLHLNSSLHEWNYQNATDIGTTVTMVDTGSVGGLNMTNPDAASKPTISGGFITFDGVSQYVTKDVSNFRGSDSTGVVHVWLNYISGGAVGFTSSQDSVATGYVSCNVTGANKPQINLNDGALRLKRMTPTISGLVLVSFVQDGLSGLLFINGIKQTTYDSDTLGTRWFNTITSDNIAVGVLRAAYFYQSLNLKYLAYCPFVDEATVTSEANKILNSNL